MFKLELEKAGEPETASYPFYHLFKYSKQNADILWIIEKAREFQKNIYFCFTDYDKAFDCVDHNKLWKNVRDGNTRPPYLPPVKPVCRSRSNS